MPIFVERSSMGVSAEALFAWHERPGALERLLPPWQNVRVLERTGRMRDGDRVVLGFGRGPAKFRWVAVQSETVPGRQFRDAQQRGPFRRWVHTHRFVPADGGSSLLEDEVDYRLPLGFAGRVLAGRVARRELARVFRFRHERTRADLERHAAFTECGPRRISVTGATGLIGSALVAFLRAGGHEVDRLVRGELREPGDARWDPARGELDPELLERCDAVVHLAGASIAGRRWNAARREELLQSRVRGTRLLCEALGRLARPPSVLVCASAVGIYGDREDEVLDEKSASGEGFLAEVCRAWESACEPARAAGIRVVNLRSGLVVAASGGALARMLPLFRLGLGGPQGSGRQYVSWIALDDAIGAIHHAVFCEDLSGPVNATAPFPVRNAAFARTLGKVLGRPAALPLPGFAVRAALGQMGQELLLTGARVLPTRLEASGFGFRTASLESALRFELGRA